MYGFQGKERQIEVYDLNRGTRTRLTSDGYAGWLTWGPDGKRVLFGWGKTGGTNIFAQPFDNSLPMERLTQSENVQFPSSSSQNAQILAFVEISPSTGADVMLLNLIERKVTPLLNSRFEEHHPEFSPDGHWIAYESNESGRLEIYVQPFPGPGGKRQISNEGGYEPLWSRNGKQLFYKGPSRRVWVVDVLGGSDFAVSKPQPLFQMQGSYGAGTYTRSWDTSLNDQRFLMVKMEERKSQPITELILVQNWIEEIERLVPNGKK